MATLSCFGLGAISGAAFFRIERVHPQPMLDLHLLADRLFSTAVLSAMLNYVAAFFQTFPAPFCLLQARGLDPQTTGLLIMVSGLAMLGLTPFADSLSDRIGSRSLTSSGLCVSALGLVALAMLGVSSSVAAIAAAQLVVGAGAGLFSSPNTSAIMGEVPIDRRGTAAGMQAMARNVGMVLGIALAGATFSSRLATLSGPADFCGADHDTLLIGATVAFVGTLVSASQDAVSRGANSRTRRLFTARRAAAQPKSKAMSVTAVARSARSAV